jgi:deoxyadenosine/deoxycytidine kinase
MALTHTSPHITEVDPGQTEDARPTEPNKQSESQTDSHYIAVAGNIGAGKSSLVEFISQRLDIQPFFEPNEDNPFLGPFYDHMSRWSFHSQIYFLTKKFELHLDLDQTPQNVIQDRTIWEDAEIFARSLYRQGHMGDDEYETYRNLYDSICTQIQPPDLMIYLRCPVKTVKRRIRQRGRQMEQEIPTEYLERINDLYEDWIEDYSISPLMILSTHELDYMTNIVDCHDVVTTIEKYLNPS